MFNRPKPGENEDDIFAMQQAYLAEKERNRDFVPAAKVVNVRKHKSDEQPSSSPKQLKFTDNSNPQKIKKVTFDDSQIETQDVTDERIEDDKVYFPSVIPTILGDIVEKQYDKETMDSFISYNANAEITKPPSVVISQKKRVFAQRNKSKCLDIDTPCSSKTVLNKSRTNYSKVTEIDKSVVLQGDDAMDIHNENAAILDKMTEEEILEEKEKLATMIDPALLEYIKSFRKPKEPSTSKSKPIPKMMETEPLERMITEELKDLSDNDVIVHPNLNSWIHFDTLERDKLQWIKTMECVSNQKVDKPYEARFDFKGFLMPYTMEYTEETKTLFHHGEEPHRPGYSLNELFQLCRSVINQQRVLALNTIAAILEYHSVGAYSHVIDVPITKIYFVLRFALDENAPIILEPALKAMRNLIFNRVDEACLDYLLVTEKGLFQPRLISMKSKTEEAVSDVAEIKDFHLVDLDLITGSIRTDLLLRLRYILTVVKPSFASVEYCLQILTRIARDSVSNVENLMKIDGLLEFVITEYIPKYISNAALVTDTDNRKLTLDTLKLIRILVCQSKRCAELLCMKYQLLESLLSYIGNTITENTLVLKIQIEAFYLWSSLLLYGLGLNDFMDIKFLLLRIFDNHLRVTDISPTFPIMMSAHAAALVTLVKHARLAFAQTNPMDNTLMEDFEPLFASALQKWTTQLSSLESYTAGHLKMLLALFLILCDLQTNNETTVDMANVKNCILKMLHSKGFNNVSSNLISCSNLLSSIERDDRSEESNLPNLEGSFITNVHNLLPTLTVTSPIHFISSLSKYILITKDKEMCSSFINDKNILNYVKTISSTKQLRLSDNWFSKTELDILCNIVCMMTVFECNDTLKEIMYNLAFKLTYILTSEYKVELEFILKNIVFNKECFSTDRLLKNLNLSETNNILNNLDAIFECYMSILKLNSFDDSSCLIVSNWNQRILPRDWMFIPILGLYTKSQEWESSKIAKCLIEARDDLVKHVVICSLKWILVSELYFPEITNEIGLTDRFCRLSCVFLCDNSVFLDGEVKPLLQKCVKIIFDIENSLFVKNKLDFNKQLLGINNFQDFYTQLVHQFQAVSYGDPTFSACILVPLAQKHNVQWKKIVWSEYAACLRALDCPEEYLCYKLENYLNPPEMDFSLLKCYHRALISNLLRPDTIAYKIAQNHIEFAKMRQKSNKIDSSQ